jgi:hypothetical protein
MPFGGPPLPAATVATIRQWVTDGAQRATAMASVTALAVAAVVPAPGDILLERPTVIVLEFNRELDATRIDESSVELLRIVAGRGGEITLPIAVELRVPRVNPQALLVTPRSPLANGRYRVVVPGEPATGLADLDGRRLTFAGAKQRVTEFLVEGEP